MRVPTNAFPSSLINQLNQLNTRQNRLQNQAATGQRVQWAEDDPAAMQRALELQSASRTNSQYGKNIDFLKERTTTSLSAIRSVQTVLDRAGEIATLADGTKSPQELSAYAGEVDQLIRQAVTASNRQNRGDYIFGGTLTNQPPFVLTENADHEVTAVTYQGNTDSAELEIAEGTPLSVQIPGANTNGTGPHGFLTDSRTGADVFAHLVSLRQHLAAGDTAAIAATDRSALGKDEDNVIYHLANTGAALGRLEAASTTTTSRASELRESISRETDADLAQTLVELTSTQTAYRAALQSGANLLNTSLMDFLR
jgi:flagellar hook-associated protein 3 FlgL